MGLEQVKSEIIKKAKSDAEKIINEAKREAAQITENAKKEAEDYRKKTEATLKEYFKVMKNKGLAQVALESKKELYRHKRQIINRAFESAMKKIMAFDDRKRKEILEALFTKAKGEIDTKVIYCNKRDTGFFKGKGVMIKENNIVGGLIAENQDGSIRIDLSYETLLENIREESLQGVSQLLFK